MARLKRRGAGRKLARPAGRKYLPPVLRLFKLAVLLGLFAALLLLVPFGGRTLLDRWRSARGAGDFAARTWAEMRGTEPPPTPAAPRKGKAARPPDSGEQPGGADQPLETTTDADRKALDKLLDKHLAEKPGR
jgi:hypothetical protein